MARDFKLPDLGEGLTEAEIVQVLVAEGDEIKEDQAVLLVETEKAQVELPSPFEGRVASVHVKAGQRVKVGAVLLSFADAGTPAPSAPSAPAPPARPAAPTPTSPTPGSAPAAGLPAAATPATRRLARELGVDLARVRGTGPGGRILDADVRGAAGERAAAAPAPTPSSSRASSPTPAGPVEAPRPLAGPVALPALPRFEQWGPVEREALRNIRRRSAEHLALAWAVIPHVTQHDQADVTELETMRRRHQKRGGDGSTDLTLTVFLIKAV